MHIVNEEAMGEHLQTLICHIYSIAKSTKDLSILNNVYT